MTQMNYPNDSLDKALHDNSSFLNLMHHRYGEVVVTLFSEMK